MKINSKLAVEVGVKVGVQLQIRVGGCADGWVGGLTKKSILEQLELAEIVIGRVDSWKGIWDSLISGWGLQEVYWDIIMLKKD